MEPDTGRQGESGKVDVWELLRRHSVLEERVTNNRTELRDDVDGLEVRLDKREESNGELRKEVTTHLLSVSEKFGRLDERLTAVSEQVKSTKNLLVGLLVGFAISVVGGVVALILHK